MSNNSVNSSNFVVNLDYSISTTYTDAGGDIPLDNTTPQKTEGAEITTLAFAPKNTTNVLYIENGVTGCSVILTTALFTDDNADSICAKASFCFGGNDEPINLNFKYGYIPGSTSSVTYKLRASRYINGDVAGRKYGGVCNAYMFIWEFYA